MTTLYFAYGSNMFAAWLRSRCSTAQERGIAIAQGWALNFSKRSMDGSGKATIIEQCGSNLFGVVYDLDDSQLGDLDRAEGPGYQLTNDFVVQMATSGELVRTITYIANPAQTDDTLKPYDWYLDLVLAGGRQHGLPSEYVSRLEAIPVRVDQVTDRPLRLRALALLGSDWS